MCNNDNNNMQSIQENQRYVCLIKLVRNCILVKICIVVLLVLLFTVYTQLSNKISNNVTIIQEIRSNDSDCAVMHIGVVCVGYDYIPHFYVMLKSLIYFRNNPLHFHIVVNNDSRKIIKGLFETWTLPQVTVSFYDVNTLQYDFRTHTYGNYGTNTLKFALLKAISTDVASRIIIIDPDIIVNIDIRKLWDEFDYYSQTQTMLSRNFQVNQIMQEKNAIFRTFNSLMIPSGMVTNTFAFKSQAIGLLTPNQNSNDLKSNNQGDELDEEDDKRFSLHIILYYLNSFKTSRQLEEWFTIINGIYKSSNTKQNVIYKILNKHQHMLYYLSNWSIKPVNISSYYGRKIKILIDSQLDPNSIDNLRNIYQIINYDGSLLLNQTYKCMDKSKRVAVTHKSEIRNESDCPDFNEVANHQWRTLLFIREFKYNASEGDLTFVSQLSYSRRQVLEDLGNYWKGPMSLTVYLNDSELSDFINFIAESKILQNRCDIAYHAVFKEGNNHPINVLRNVALRHVTTPYVFLIDIDFVPMPNLYPMLKEYISKMGNMKKKALIVPAFETKTILPKNKAELLQMMNDRVLFPFHHLVYQKAHAPTNYKKWKLANNSYQVLWKPCFEPYVVVQSNVTEYDTRFFGYGWNKVTHIMELKEQHYKFIVLPNVYIVHKPHKISDDRRTFVRSYKLQKCLNDLTNKFREEIQRKYKKKH